MPELLNGMLVNFDTNGGNRISPVIVTEGQSLEDATEGNIPLPVKDGFTFDGYTFDENFNQNGDKTQISGYIAANGSLVLSLYYTKDDITGIGKIDKPKEKIKIKKLKPKETKKVIKKPKADAKSNKETIETSDKMDLKILIGLFSLSLITLLGITRKKQK